MPVISFDHEMEGEEEKEEESSQGVIDASRDPLQPNSASGVPRSVSNQTTPKNHEEDSKMRCDDDASVESEEDDGYTPEERLKQEAIANEYEKDI